MSLTAKTPRGAQLLPSEVALRSSTLFGRARNYPIFSMPWYRYRSVAMVLGAVLIFLVMAAIIWAPFARPGTSGIGWDDVIRALASKLLVTLVVILVGPFFAVKVRSLSLSRRLETAALTAVLLAGVGLAIATDMAVSAWAGRLVFDESVGAQVSRPIPRIQMRIEVVARGTPTRPGRASPSPLPEGSYIAISPEIKAALRELREANGADTPRTDPLSAQPDSDNDLQRLLHTLADPYISEHHRSAQIARYAMKVAHATSGSHGATGYSPNLRQAKAINNLIVQLFSFGRHSADANPDAKVTKGLGVASILALLIAVLCMVFWLGGFGDLAAYLRQRDNLSEVLQKQALDKAEAGRSVAEARLSMLAAQVEPHFLFNSLASVRSAITSDPARATHIIDQMVNYLRSTIPQMRDDVIKSLVPLATQMDSVRSYLALMHERMPRLHYVVETGPGLVNAMVPPLMLISLVENAIKHGIEPKVGAGTIQVLARRGLNDELGMLELEVIDDGVGFGDAASGGGIGLTNIHARLRSYFGATAALTLRAVPEGGVAASLSLPLSFES